VERLHQWQAVLPQTIQLGPRTLLEMKGPSDRELTAYEKRNRHEVDSRGCVARLAERLRKARRIAREKLTQVRRDQHTRHDRQARRVEYRPGELVYRKQMVRGNKLEPKWIGPYQVRRKISDLVYRIQIRNREVNLHVEQLKLCRAS
jgi:hypothetical protein